MEERKGYSGKKNFPLFASHISFPPRSLLSADVEVSVQRGGVCRAAKRLLGKSHLPSEEGRRRSLLKFPHFALDAHFNSSWRAP